MFGRRDEYLRVMYSTEGAQDYLARSSWSFVETQRFEKQVTSEQAVVFRSLDSFALDCLHCLRNPRPWSRLSPTALKL